MKFENNIISANEMKNVKGGKWYCCECTGTAGQWSNEFSSQADADKTIAQYCSTGTGTCS